LMGDILPTGAPLLRYINLGKQHCRSMNWCSLLVNMNWKLLLFRNLASPRVCQQYCTHAVRLYNFLPQPRLYRIYTRTADCRRGNCHDGKELYRQIGVTSVTIAGVIKSSRQNSHKTHAKLDDSVQSATINHEYDDQLEYT